MRRLQVLALAFGLMLTLGVSAASAAPIRVFQSMFDGAGASKGSFTAGGGEAIGIDRDAEIAYVADRGHGGVVNKFDLEGNPLNFSGLGSNALTVGKYSAGQAKLAVDNSGLATQGNIYFIAGAGRQEEFSAHGTLTGYGPDGKSLSANYPVADGGQGICGVDVASTGNPWVATLNSFTQNEYTPSGVPTGKQLHPGDIFGFGCFTAFDSEENLYFFAPFELGVRKINASDDSAEAFGDTFIGTGVTAVATNPLNDDVYIDQGSFISVFHPDGELFETLTGFRNSESMAFDADGNLYVADSGAPTAASAPAPATVQVLAYQEPGVPVLQRPASIEVTSSGATITAQIGTAGSSTSYHVEYGTTTQYGATAPATAPTLADRTAGYRTRTSLVGLAPGTTYHYQVIASNASGVTPGPDRTFTTLAAPGSADDPCPNALARQQTGTARLLDCRAYELVSAPDTGGYDVESSLVPGQAPFAGYPLATSPARVLYAVHAGVVPGPWKPTNRGPDPYVSTRGADGWNTQYVGLPADINPGAGGFSSSLGGADAALDAFAFAGTDLCSPCFTSGLETGIPVRLPSGQLVQGMAGSLDPGAPAAKPEGKVAKYFSADGTHLVFASRYAFEPGANNNGTDLTVYDRNLSTGTTQIASTDTGGATLSGPGISEIGLSSNGSRIVIGKKVSTDGSGNEYVLPYMHLGASPNSVDLAPGTTSGVLYAGMTSDGSRVFFTTPDKLLPADTDSSADLYAAAVDSAGTVTLSLVSDSNSNACTPSFGASGCAAVAIGGGGGVASESGAVYFLSPESFGGKGTLDQPNLYLAEPGQAPVFVGTLEPGNPLVVDSVGNAAGRETGEFQTTGAGAYAVFASRLPLTGLTNNNHALEVFRYDVAGDRLDCASCQTSEAERETAFGDSTLAPDGLSLTDDGRVFFNTAAALVLNDTNRRPDVYEWAQGNRQLISQGLSAFDSGLLSVTPDGTDAYFFTHDTLAAEDLNGSLTKIYDARSGGGFFHLPADVPCAASDECHGPGTISPPPPAIRSSGRTTDGNVLVCRKSQVKKNGRCVKKPTKKKHKKRTHRKAQKHA